ncbi:phage portal protein family protein [Fimbriiglobus ruber]
MAGRAHGVGLRDYVYWAWWLRDEMLSWLTDYMEKVGSMGLLLFYYEDGNPAAEAAAKQAAADARGKSALAVPVPRGRDKDAAKVEVIAAQTAGAQFLVDMVDRYFERHIERLYVGQSLSAGTAGSGLGGSGVAALHADTKFNLLAWDADNLGDTLTRDLVGVLQHLNFRGAPGGIGGPSGSPTRTPKPSSTRW